ncbi:hypothetical protein BJ912DRAFT_1059809 [Pholiota molesta]|nr:hypothetical protein BJ912DRAFT_1059809 [Pholiota molesta]
MLALGSHGQALTRDDITDWAILDEERLPFQLPPSNMRMLEQEEETDDAAEVTWEDQQRINTFSKLNNRIRIIEEKLTDLKVSLRRARFSISADPVPIARKEALDDLSTELELADEDELVLYKVGEAFVHMPQPRALKRLEKDQAIVDSKVSALAVQADDCEMQMKELKVNCTPSSASYQFGRVKWNIQWVAVDFRKSPGILLEYCPLQHISLPPL